MQSIHVAPSLAGFSSLNFGTRHLRGMKPLCAFERIDGGAESGRTGVGRFGRNSLDHPSTSSEHPSPLHSSPSVLEPRGRSSFGCRGIDPRAQVTRVWHTRDCPKIFAQGFSCDIRRFEISFDTVHTTVFFKKFLQVQSVGDIAHFFPIHKICLLTELLALKILIGF